jgi:hypothetical protein
VTLKRGREVDPQALASFYGDVFPDRPIVRSWRWLYRDSSVGAFPLVVADGGRVVAHAGGIPFTARLDGRSYQAAWYVDFVVRPEYQRRGLGINLTEEWMKASDLCVTFCNDRSMGVFRRFGWVESFETAYHTLWLRPFEHPRINRLAPGVLGRVANALAWPLIAGFHALSGGREAHLEPIEAAALERLPRSDGYESGTVAALHDADYFAWRLAASPDRGDYRMVRDENVTMIVRVLGAVRATVDVLWMSPEATTAPRVARRMLASLAVWASRRGRVSVRYYPPDATLDAELRALRPLVSRPRLAFWARDAALLASLRQARWRWHMIDSDFEWT